jgi:DNA-binding response OmpR family regulator
MRVAALDDDVEELDLIKSTLRAVGHDCHVFTEGSALQRELRRETFDLLVLDWHLPDTTGPDIVQWVRAHLPGRIPILFVTNRRQERDIVEGLAAGADDFMMKPIRVGELAARVQALLRRAYAEPEPDEQTWDRYRFRLASRQVEMDGEHIALTHKEFDLALTLFRNMGRLLSRQYLLEAIWSNNNPLGSDLMSRSLDTHISRVRTALRLRPENGFRLASVYGQGYRFEALHADDSHLA